ncbi:MAG TPA: NADH-quinone oxidoreductase subunit L [Dehalococcoidia bacterium]
MIKEGFVWAIMFLPLASFALITLVSFLGLTHSQDGRPAVWNVRYSSYVTILAILGSFLLSIWAFAKVADNDGTRIGYEAHHWLTVGSLNISLGITLDGLTAVMLVVVTGVSLLVQIYSQEYMRGDEGYNRYFAYMSLFTMSMLGLVLASSVIQLFVFWELVGLCSYLLIGFWFYKDSARKAATKAFLVTRVGDLGFMVALLIIFTQAHTLDIAGIHQAAIAGTIGSTWLTLFALGLFAGAAGKSAQFPLHVWLPDAMEGPTPVSALIHAATMVAAGVYLVARFFPVFAESETALVTVAAIGAVTTIIAALMGIVATDIKRVMAYSTISQLGYMMMGLGVGGMVAAIFHLFTHAFFKSLLFLGSGSVNHATGTFDMRRMGGLRKYMPVTYATMVVASFALVGVFPFAGFWSKDEILADAWSDRWWVFVVAMIGIYLTAVYVGRMLILTFEGEYRGGLDVEDAEHAGDAHAGGHHGEPHESPPIMTVPLLILAVLAMAAGAFQLNHWLGDIIDGWLPAETAKLATDASFKLWIAALSVSIGLAGLATSWLIYQVRIVEPQRIRSFLEPLPEILENRFYLDALYQDVFLKLFVFGSVAWLLSLWDEYVVDGLVNGVGTTTRWVSGQIRVAQSGQAQVYASIMFFGTIAAVVGILVVSRT